MDIQLTLLRESTQHAVRTATKTPSGWTMQSPCGAVVGGTLYDDLAALFGPNGIQAMLVGGKVIVTPGSSAYQMIENIHAAQKPVRRPLQGGAHSPDKSHVQINICDNGQISPHALIRNCARTENQAMLIVAEQGLEPLPDHGGGQTDHYDAEDGPHVCGYEPDGHGVFIVHAMRPAAAAPCSTYAPFTVLFMLPDYLRSGQSCAADMLTRAFTKAVDAGTAPDAALTHLMSAGLIDPDDADDYAPVAVYEGHISDRLTP